MTTQKKKKLLFYVIVRFIYLISTNTSFAINLFQYFMLFNFCKFCTYRGNLTQHFMLFDCIGKKNYYFMQLKLKFNRSCDIDYLQKNL